ncbi:hypothetical protein NST77_08350 [Niallia sp. FSL W8-0177]
MNTTYAIYSAKSGVQLENENHLRHPFHEKQRSSSLNALTLINN